MNEYSDEDEENEFSSGEQEDDGTDAGITGYDAKRGYAAKHDLRKYRKLERSENDGDDGALCTNPVDSDSEFENLKDKGSRAKISRVSFRVYISFSAIRNLKTNFLVIVAAEKF